MEKKSTALTAWIRPSNLSEGLQLAAELCKSDLVPKEFRGKPGNILIVMQYADDVGMGYMQALQSVAVINGRPTIWGDAALALVLGHPQCEGVEETVTEHHGQLRATCTVKRRGREPVVETFGEEDAKLAGLWGKSGPWTQYPKRMLRYRARGFALRDAFADVLKGILTREEVEDYAPAEFTVVPEGATRSEQLANQLGVEKPPAPEPATEDEIMAVAGRKADCMEQIDELLVQVSSAVGKPVSKLEAMLIEKHGKPFLEMSLDELQRIQKGLETRIEEVAQEKV